MNIKAMLFKTCPKTGRIRGFRTDGMIYKLFFPILGLLSLLWFLIRVIPKPDRMTYPCQQVAAPFAFTFVSTIAGYVALFFTVKNFKNYIKQHRYVLSAVVVVVGLGLSLGFYTISMHSSWAQPNTVDHGKSTGTFTPTDLPNQPMGTATGIYPGRVVWIHDPLSTAWDSTGYFWEARFNSQDRVSNMLESSLCSLTGKKNMNDAWNALFVYFNERKGFGKTGYKKGEKVAVKINLNCNGGSNRIDASPQMVYALLKQLTQVVGVAQEDILLYDIMRGGIAAVFDYNYPHFPKVKYNDWGKLVPNSVMYSSEIVDSLASCLPSGLMESKYLINMAVLKRHCEPTDNYKENAGQTGVTLCAKNHFGSIANPSALHMSIRDWARGMKTYNANVDLMSSDNIGGKTLVYLIDGTYGGSKHGITPARFRSLPFNNHWPSSLLASLDICAIESVGLDFLRAEMPLVANADNYIHEASQIGNPPSGTKYLRRDMVSLGVHEHWNNPTDKQYSRNLGTGKGIELYKVDPDASKPIVDYVYANKRYVFAGDSVTLSWKTSNSTATTLNNENVVLSGSLKTKINKTTTYVLRATNGKVTSEFSYPVKVLNKIQEIEAENCKLSSTCELGTEGTGWTGTGWIMLTSRREWGKAEWQVDAPAEGQYYLILRHSGNSPYAATLHINSLFVSRSVGFITTEVGKWKDYVYPIQLVKGKNTLALSHDRTIRFDKFTVAY